MKKPSTLPSKRLSEPLPTYDTPAIALASPPPTSKASALPMGGERTYWENCRITDAPTPSGRPDVPSAFVSGFFGFRCSVPSLAFAPCAMSAVRRTRNRSALPGGTATRHQSATRCLPGIAPSLPSLLPSRAVFDDAAVRDTVRSSRPLCPGVPLRGTGRLRRRPPGFATPLRVRPTVPHPPSAPHMARQRKTCWPATC